MKITPVEIRNQEFKRSMRGYDMVEVDTFMDLIANEYTAVIQENEQLNKQLLKLESELKNFKEVERTLKQTLYNVQESSQVSKENSQKEAILIKREAELAATQMIERARSDVQKMKQEVTALHNQKQSFIARLRHVLSSQMELLDVLEPDDFDVSKLKDRTSKKIAGAAETKPQQTQKPEIRMPASEETLPKKPNPENRASETENPSESSKDDVFFDDIFGDDDQSKGS